MSVSTSTSFTMTLNEIIETAFNNIGVGTEGEALTARMFSDGKRQSNLLVKSWGAMEHLWTKTERAVPTVAGQASYALSPKPMRVLSVRRSIGGVETPLNEMARSTYFDQPNKTLSPSTPVSFYYDPQQATGTLYLWPAPSSAFAASWVLSITYLRRMADMVDANDELDMPQEWLDAFIWNLSKRLMPQYPVNDRAVAQDIKDIADQSFRAIKGWDNEPASIYLQPDMPFA